MGEDGDDKKDPPKPKGDQITNVIGDLGRWHFEKILIVFFASAPGNNMQYRFVTSQTFDHSQRSCSYFPRKFHNSQAEVLVCSSIG